MATANPGKIVTSFTAAWRLLDGGRDRAELYRMWRVGLSAGFTVPATLETMGPREAPHVERIRLWLLEGTRRGESVAALAIRAGTRLEPFERGLLVIGDETGHLEQSLGLLAHFYARKHAMMLRVRKRMAYPLFTGVCATCIAPLPLLLFGRPLVYLLIVTGGMAGWVLGGGAIVAAAASFYGRQPALVRARLGRALVTAIEAGLPLPRAVRLAADASADPAVQRFVGAIGEGALSSQPLAVTLAGCPHLTPEFLAMVHTAERTGDWSSSVGRIADLYEDGFR